MDLFTAITTTAAAATRIVGLICGSFNSRKVRLKTADLELEARNAREARELMESARRFSQANKGNSDGSGPAACH